MRRLIAITEADDAENKWDHATMIEELPQRGHFVPMSVRKEVALVNKYLQKK